MIPSRSASHARSRELDRQRARIVEELRKLKISPRERARLIARLKEAGRQAKRQRERLDKIADETHLSLDELRAAAHPFAENNDLRL